MNRLKKRCRAWRGKVPIITAVLTVGAFLLGLQVSPEAPWGLFGLPSFPTFAFLLCSLSLWLWTRRSVTPWMRTTAMGLGIAICVVGAWYLFRWDGLDGTNGTRFSEWSTPRGPLCLIFLGLALGCFHWTLQRKIRPAEFFAFFALGLGVFSLLCEAYHRVGAPPCNNHPVSLATAFIVILLALGILCGRTRGGLMLVFLNSTATARLLRRLIFLVLGALPLLGWGQIVLRRGSPNPPSPFWISLMLLCSLGIFIFAVLALGARLLKTEMLRRRAEHRRSMREVDFRATIEQAAVGIAHVACSGRFLRTNSRLSTMLGYSREEFAKLTFQDITYPADLGTDLEYFQNVLSGKLSRYITEKRYIKRDGSLLWGNLTVALLRTAEGKPRYFISVVEDITVWKRTQEELEAVSKAKDRFISVISHELRTPLTPVLAALSGSIDKGLGDPETVEMMRRNIEHEASIINDLLDLTRISSTGKLRLELQPVDLHGLIMEVVQGIESPLQQKGLACRLSLSAPRHIVNGDPTRLRQIFLNLLDNAMKFTPSGGTITIETAEGQERDSILICVRDSGIGIEPGNLERIFDAFEQATPSSPRRYGGLGLGLAIVRGLVEAHGGSIRAQNPESGGAEFIFDLHLTSRPVVEMEPCRVQEARGMRILLVEDHADTRETLMRLLERRGHTVSVAKGVSDARELLEGSAFDLVISDIGLPDGSGLDIPAVARSGGYAVSCIALSGFGTEDDIQKSFRAGFSHHLTKPVEMNVLDAAIADLRGRNRSS